MSSLLSRLARLSPWVILGILAAVPGWAVTLDKEEQAFATYINQYRQQQGLAPLKISPALESASEWMSADMAQHQTFSHTDQQGRQLDRRLTDFGYTAETTMGENIAAGNATALETFHLWQASPEHNLNMLDPSFRVMGIARSYLADSKFGWYWVNDFGGNEDAGSFMPAPVTSAVTHAKAKKHRATSHRTKRHVRSRRR